MTLSLTQSATALAPNVSASFLAVGGTSPYSYSVVTGGAGGTISASTGVYTAPAAASLIPSRFYDTVMVTDHVSAVATAKILVGTPLILFCDIIQTQIGLDGNHCYLFDQKIPEPSDSGLFVVVSVPSLKPFGSVNQFNPTTGNAEQYLTVMATLDIDVISRSNQALYRKEEVLLALASNYAEQQQEANSFMIGRLPASSRFINLSGIDGAAIPYRYRISVNMQYTYQKFVQASYFDAFDAEIVTEEETVEVPIT